ncbi:biotin transporter BioY [Aeromicrobium endophyticum]|uniref:Biotin transporter n=1 Tax=Aeromicrobium endophyticum TaxID=2292704 RepID=A0A371PBU6_9ACTN|nr:biotin transporter BioY [Aeromicrobium endophyticum]REK73411.1 biotin transporter BioY [Aeromicrobium endophyticum]
MSSTTTRRRPARGLSTTDLALVATFAALIAVCSILPAISTASGTPFTLQMFAIFLAGATLGATRSFLAVVLYLAVGTAGLPIFSQGAAGPATWAGATGGYLLAFPLAALLVGLAAARVARGNPTRFVLVVSVVAAVVTIVVVGALGTLGMAWRLDVSLKVAWGYATPFFVYDIIKGVLAAVVAASVHRAFPQLSARR